ncbi:hypothetical protein F4678DRAFT_482646 [Xylaria arbuscula]|nr:hypothetical protein F4678DRAFT_482646 [Xylaria arbuscula]
MLAVDMSLSKATAFCNEFGRPLAAAASNLQTNGTLTGDAEAIDPVHTRLIENDTFTRVLQVSMAYRSQCMKPCAGLWLEAMKHCKIRVQKRRGECQWYSSYWVNNLTQVVPFSQALSEALNETSIVTLHLKLDPIRPISPS